MQNNKHVAMIHSTFMFVSLQIRISKAANGDFKKNLGRFLAPDQIRRLEVAGKGTGFKWRETTVKEAIQIRIMTGVNGYNYLRQTVGYPLPSYRTLCRHLEGCSFQPGWDNEIISFLGTKIRGEEEINR